MFWFNIGFYNFTLFKENLVNKLECIDNVIFDIVIRIRILMYRKKYKYICLKWFLIWFFRLDSSFGNFVLFWGLCELICNFLMFIY